MIKYSVNKTVKLTKTQNETLNVLKKVYKINTQSFIRDAIKEKKEIIYCPF